MKTTKKNSPIVPLRLLHPTSILFKNPCFRHRFIIAPTQQLLLRAGRRKRSAVSILLEQKFRELNACETLDEEEEAEVMSDEVLRNTAINCFSGREPLPLEDEIKEKMDLLRKREKMGLANIRIQKALSIILQENFPNPF